MDKKPELTAEERERYWHYGNTTEYQPQVRMAGMWDDDEDEYDDTYDAQPEFGADDGTVVDKPAAPAHRAFEVEPLNEKKARSGPKWGEDEEDEDDEVDRPRDVFCENPEEVRRRYEQRRGVGGHRGGGGSVRGNPRGAGQDDATLRSRRKKEQNKSVAANHNRRSQAQWKRRGF